MILAISIILCFWGQQTYDAREVIENSAKVMLPSNWMNERINAYLEKYALNDMAQIPPMVILTLPQ